MVMDPHFSEFPDLISSFKVDDEAALPNFDQSQNLSNGFNYKDDSFDIKFMDLPSFSPSLDPGNQAPSSGGSSEADSPDDFSETVLKFLNQILVEENMEEKPSMFHDPLALQAAEKSFYDVLCEKYPPSPNQPSFYTNQNIDSPDYFFGSSSESSTNSGTSGSNSTDSQWIIDPGELLSSVRQSHPSEHSFQAGSQWSFGSVNSFSNNANPLVDPFGISSVNSSSNNVNDPMYHSVSTPLFPNVFSDAESIMLFKRGMEEASKFLPSSNQLVIDLEKYSLPNALSSEPKLNSSEVIVKVEKDERDYSPNGSRGRKNHYREDGDLEEERSSKQSAVYVEEAELSEMFDRVLLSTESVCCNADEELPNGTGKTLLENGQSSGGQTLARKQVDTKEVVDLRTLLICCAQSVATDDRRTANEQLKQIRQHASPSGDASQRLAHIFANGLEARLAGTGTQLYKALASKRISAAEKLKAYQLYLSACPFKRISIFFANKMIIHAAEKAAKLHIIDFGILYGFQWPILIQYLSMRSGGPPKLRITGIDLPQPGFRPSERVEETGRRLAKYCERFNVPFEYNAIATQKWETIKIEDLKIQSDEVVAVNSLFRFKNLLDDTVAVDNPRDAVLKLIRKMNPDIFVHSIINGSYSAPFFVTRFREALFSFSALFDMFDNTIPRDNQERMNFEQEFNGREVINVIACEGLERVERPETYKLWQIRNIRNGFRLLPLNQELLKKLRGKVKAGYHKDFVFDEDGGWMLQGWKGRILCASSCWVPA